MLQLNNLPDVVSADGSCFVTYTRDKQGNVIAAHCTEGIVAAPARRKLSVRPHFRNIPKSQRTYRGQTALQRAEALFA